MENSSGKVQEEPSWDLGFNVRKFSRWVDEKGRMFIVLEKWRDWDSKRKEFTPWKTITLLNLEQEKTEDPMLYDRFVNYVANSKLKPYIPTPVDTFKIPE